MRPELELVPLHAGWYAGENPWTSVYGLPLRLAGAARGLDSSPVWLAHIGRCGGAALARRPGHGGGPGALRGLADTV